MFASSSESSACSDSSGSSALLIAVLFERTLVSIVPSVAICTNDMHRTDFLFSCRSGRGDTMKRFELRLTCLALLTLAGVAGAQGPGCPPGCKVVWIDQAVTCQK